MSDEAKNVITTPNFHWGSNQKLLLLLLFVGIAVVAWLGWEYYREWRMKRSFERYWQGKPPKAGKRFARFFERFKGSKK